MSTPSVPSWHHEWGAWTQGTQTPATNGASKYGPRSTHLARGRIPDTVIHLPRPGDQNRSGAMIWARWWLECKQDAVITGKKSLLILTPHVLTTEITNQTLSHELAKKQNDKTNFYLRIFYVLLFSKIPVFISWRDQYWPHKRKSFHSGDFEVKYLSLLS